MTEPVTISLLGAPVAWARARLGKQNVHYTPTPQRNCAAALRIAAHNAMQGRKPFTGPIVMSLRAEFPIPTSWPKREQQAALLQKILPSKRPDLSNIAKLIEDALNTVVYRDDALIVRYDTLEKIYSDEPKIVVTIREIGEAS